MTLSLFVPNFRCQLTSSILTAANLIQKLAVTTKEASYENRRTFMQGKMYEDLVLIDAFYQGYGLLIKYICVIDIDESRQILPLLANGCW